MNRLKHQNSQYGPILRLALPVVLSQLGQVIVQFADNAMVGQLGVLPLAAVSFGSSVFFILFIFGIGITIGITPLVGAHYARNERLEMSGYLKNAILFYLLSGIAITAIQLAFIPAMYHLGQPVEVVDMALPYYRYVAWSMIPLMLYGAFKQFLEGIGNTTTAMIVVIACNLLNIFLNWIFIYGHWGAPAMGAAGAGFATFISRMVMPVSMIVYFFTNRRVRPYMALLRRVSFNFPRVLQLFRVGVPIAFQMTLEGLAFVLTSIMMGWIGTTEIAANQITITLSNAAFMIILGIGSATTILISHAYGARNWRLLRQTARSAYHIGLIWNLCSATAFISARYVLAKIFTDDPAVLQITSSLLIIAAVFQIFDGLQCVSMGILRGIKDVSITMGIAFLSYIVINLPVGYLFAFVFGLGADGLWCGYIFGLSIAALLLNMRYRRLIRRLSSQPEPAK